jgi:hypothetical protein
MDCFVAFAPLRKRFAFVAGNDVRMHFRIPAARSVRVLPKTFRPLDQRAQGMPGARCARSLACKSRKHASKSPRSHRKHPAFPTQWFYGFLRALPGDRTGDRAFLSPSPHGFLSAKLDAGVEASGPHDFAVREISALVSRAFRVHRIPRSAFVTIAKRPFQRRRDGGGCIADLGKGRSGIFLQMGLDDPNHVDPPQQNSVLAQAAGRWMEKRARDPISRPFLLPESLTPIARTS